MTKNILSSLAILLCLFSCKKEINQKKQLQEVASAAKSANAEIPPFNLEVILRGEGGSFGHVSFRQDVDPAKIITLNTWIRDLEPNHQYQLQRAVDTNIDGNCTGTSWLTLGKGLTPQTITTDDTGTGREELWRDVSAIPTRSTFDIHFRVIDAVTHAVVLASDCYHYTVR